MNRLLLTHVRDQAWRRSHYLLPNYFWEELRTTFGSTLHAPCVPTPNKVVRKIRSVKRRLAPAVWRNGSVGLSINMLYERYTGWHDRF